MADPAGVYADADLVTAGLRQVALLHAEAAARFRNDHRAHLQHGGLRCEQNQLYRCRERAAYSDPPANVAYGAKGRNSNCPSFPLRGLRDPPVEFTQPDYFRLGLLCARDNEGPLTRWVGNNIFLGILVVLKKLNKNNELHS